MVIKVYDIWDYPNALGTINNMVVAVDNKFGNSVYSVKDKMAGRIIGTFNKNFDKRNTFTAKGTARIHDTIQKVFLDIRVTDYELTYLTCIVNGIAYRGQISKCTCGSASVGSPKHSDWCDKAIDLMLNEQ